MISINDNINYKELSEITRKRIDRLDLELNNITDNIENSSIDSKKDEKIKRLYLESYGGNNPIIIKLLGSYDYSTHNIGVLLSNIERNHPELFNDILNKVMDNIIEEDNILTYKGKPFDYYSLISLISVLDNFLSNDQEKETVINLLNNTLSNEPNNDFEFKTYYYFIKRRISENSKIERLDRMLEILQRCYSNPASKEAALDNIRKLYYLVQERNLVFISQKKTSCYYHNIPAIGIDELYDTDLIYLHEFGHAVDLTFSKRDQQTKPVTMLEKGKANLNSNPHSIELLQIIMKHYEENVKIARMSYDIEMEKKYGSIDKAISHIEETLKSSINATILAEILDHFRFADKKELLDDYNNGRLDIHNLAVRIYEKDKFIHSEEVGQKDPYSYALDIITSLFGSYSITMNGESTTVRFGHSQEYYNTGQDTNMREIIANINTLLVSGNIELLNMLKEIIGEELYNYIMEDYNQGMITIEEQQPGISMI